MPLRMVLGTKNPSDMMTKNVPCTTMELYLNMLQLRFASGRAKIAQQLHSMGEMSNHDALVRASLEAGDPRAGLSRVIGGQEDPRVDASLCVGDPSAGLTNVLGGSGMDRCIDRLHFNNCHMPRKEVDSKAEERHIDSWGKQGQGGRWTRIHRTSRRSLFTPFKVSGGPGKQAGLKKIRITRGKFFNTGRVFKIIDDWTIQSHAHRMLEGSWIGTTDFRETVECIDDDSDSDIDIGAQEQGDIDKDLKLLGNIEVQAALSSTPTPNSN